MKVAAKAVAKAAAVVAAIDRREVPRDWRLGRGGWIVLLAILAAATGAVVVWQWPQRAAPAGVATIAPLHRLLVLPHRPIAEQAGDEDHGLAG